MAQRPRTGAGTLKPPSSRMLNGNSHQQAPSKQLQTLEPPGSRVVQQDQDLPIYPEARPESSQFSVACSRLPNVDQQHGCAPSLPRQRLKLKNKVATARPPMQQSSNCPATNAADNLRPLQIQIQGLRLDKRCCKSFGARTGRTIC